ncbi:MAG TPA: hypothetical protein VGK67_18235 [Myxococcales bacterium]
MAKQPPGDPAKKAVARRDDGPTHQMAVHPEFADEVEDTTDQSMVPAELLKKPGFSSDTRVEPAPPARPASKPAAGDKTAPETKLASLLPDEKPGFSSDTRVEPAPPARAEPREPKPVRDSKEAKEPRESKGGFSSDTHVEPAPPPPRPEAKEPRSAKESKEQKEPKGYFERTDPAAKPEPPAPQAPADDALPWESGESAFGATTPLPDIRDQLPPEKPSEPDPDPEPEEPPRRGANRDGLRRISSPNIPAAEAARKSPKVTRDAVPISVASQETNVRAAPTSRDVAGQETRIKAAPTADERSSNKPGLANQDTSIKAAPEEPVRRRTGAHAAVRGDFPEAEPPRRGNVANASTLLKPIPEDVQEELGIERPRKAGNVANSSTVLKPIPEDVQRELGVEKPARRSGSGPAARRPAPLERPDPTPASVELDPPDEPEEPPAKPKPLPFVDKRPRLASSADLFEATVQDPEKQPGRARGAKRVDQRASKVFQTLSHLKTMSESNQKALAIVASLFGLLVVGVIAFGLSRGGDRPREDELRRAYPFGYSGARGPRGEQAPGAAELTFTFKMVAPCPQTAEPECLLYEYSKGAFMGRMLLRKTSDGWARASDEGAPFLLIK